MNDYAGTIEHTRPPFKHQREAINKAVDRLIRFGHYALFMEMGTGKTKTSINVGEILRKEGRADAIMVICPKALSLPWVEQLEEHMGSVHRVVVWDSQKSKGKQWQADVRKLLATDPDHLRVIPVLIVNVEAFQTSNDLLKRLVLNWYRSFQTLTILDESTFIKTPSAKRTKNVVELAKRSAYRMILTGSEITNSVMDLYSQFEFLSPGFWGMRNFYAFRGRYAIMKDIYVNEGRAVKKVVGFKRVDEILDKIEPYTFRALKRDCLDLPGKIYQTLPVEMNAAQKRVYSDLKDQLWTQYKGQTLTVPAKVALFTRFRQITGGFMPETGEPIGEHNPKLVTMLADLEGYPGKVIVWSNFVAEIKALEAALNDVDPEQFAVSFYGDTSTAQREAALAAFKDDPACKYLVINPATGAFGLNLQHSTLQYFYSRSLSPEKNWQAEDRSHRIGTTEHVTYKDLVCKGSIDERVNQLLRQKTNLRDKFQTMTIDDIIEMV